MIRQFIDLTALVLSALCVAETDGRPMSACDVAFLLDVPREDVDDCLRELVESGSVTQDGDLFRFDLDRSFTQAEMSRFQLLHDQLEQLQPFAQLMPPRRLNS